MADAAHTDWSGQRVLVLSPTPTHPQDFGNRKRIFQVCSRLQYSGADVTFVHYPAESEWRRANPWSAERAMVRAWSQYFTVPPSRELHSSPKGTHHTIDEWWDPAIATFLRWLFSVRTFDVFIVNYAWLSKAFEFAPPSVVKILDTHDKKSGRKELLARHGIAPEYFYTTEPQEKIALSRSNLVWAIKDEERDHFAKAAATPVLTLPHLDPARAMRRPSPDPEGYLRAGFMAARNSINQVNLTNFLKAAAPVFNAAFAPVKVVVAGSICDLMTDTDYPFVELRGRVDNVDEFYASVDCAIIPMTFSTGLKIKTGEAIAAGLPVVSTAHAFEGYQPADPLHALPDFPAMAQALADLSFAPRSRLDELAAASSITYATTEKLIDDTLAATRDLIGKEQPSMVIAVDSRAFVPGSAFNLVLRSAHEYLRSLGNVRILVVRGSAAHVVANEQLADELGRVLVAGDLPRSREFRGEFQKMHVETVDVGDYLARSRIRILVADALHHAFKGAYCADTAVFVRSEIVALAHGDGDVSLPGDGFCRSFVVSPRYSRDVATLQASNSASIVLAPCLNRLPSTGRRFKANGSTPRVVILGSPKTRGVALALSLAEAWKMQAETVSGLGEVASAAGNHAAIDYIEDLIAGRAHAPLFALDMSAGRAGLQLCREILERLGVPVVTAGSVGMHRSLGAPGLPANASTEFELSEVFRAFALDPETPTKPVFESARAAINTDRGWAHIWGFSKRLFETQDVEFA